MRTLELDEPEPADEIEPGESEDCGSIRGRRTLQRQDIPVHPKLNRVFVNSDESINRIVLTKAAPDRPYPYELTQRIRLEDHEGYPAIKPPWGYMTAIDLESGSCAWRVVNGEYEALKKSGVPKTGTFSTGGSVATGKPR